MQKKTVKHAEVSQRLEQHKVLALQKKRGRDFPGGWWGGG